MVRLEELLADKNPEQLRELILRLPLPIQAQITSAIQGYATKNDAATPRYPVRSQEFLTLVNRVESFMRRYQKRIGRGAAPIRSGNELLIGGYNWSNGTVGIVLKESEGYHGGDFIGVREQVLIEPSNTKPKSLGVVTYERGDGKLHAYSIFSLNGNSMYKETTDDYELAKLSNASPNVIQSNNPISVEQFLASVYSSRNL